MPGQEFAGRLFAARFDEEGFVSHSGFSIFSSPRIKSGVTKSGRQGQVSGVHCSVSGNGAKIASIQASVTASAVGGFHFGLLSLSTISARTPSRKSCIWTTRRSEEHTSELQSLMRIAYAV